jgi:putative transport protein
MIDLPVKNPTLLLFAVAGTGFLIGRLRVRGFSLGVAAVLFAGIAFGAIDGRLEIPEPVWTLGLAVFVYTVGLASGPGFVAAIRRRGISANAASLGGIAAGAAIVIAFGHVLLGLDGPTASGTFAGGLTNTPALAGVLEYLQHHLGASQFAASGNAPVVGYSLAYPFGVLVPLVATYWLFHSRRGGPSVSDTEAAARAAGEPIVCRTVRVSGDNTACLGALINAHGRAITFSRLKHDGVVHVATPELVPVAGDLLSVIGAEEAVRRFVAEVGDASLEHLALDHEAFDTRRMFVSSRVVAGKSVASLDLERFGAVVTRVRRGDADMVATPGTVLELGDRVRVVAPARTMREVGTFFGDSYRALSEVDVMTFSLGIALGLLLGAVHVPFPGQSFTLGAAGGPLVVGLVLGARGRTGRLVWQMPYSANLTLRQLGIVLFLAGVGTRSGQAFVHTFSSGHWPPVLATALAVAVAPVVVLVAIGKLAKTPTPVLAGMLAGMCTQPAVLSFASEQVADDAAVMTGYATVFAFAMVAKIVIAQVLVASLH